MDHKNIHGESLRNKQHMSINGQIACNSLDVNLYLIFENDTAKGLGKMIFIHYVY